MNSSNYTTWVYRGWFVVMILHGLNQEDFEGAWAVAFGALIAEAIGFLLAWSLKGERL